MTVNATKTGILAASAICAFGAMGPATAAETSFWCKTFPSFCGDESTPGGAQKMAPAPEPPAASMSTDEAPADASTTDSAAPSEPPPAQTDADPKPTE